MRETKPEGGEIRTVAVDPERGPLIVKGIELFATGQHTAKEVLDRITAAGLLTRGNRRTPPGPVSLSQFYEILSDRYYIGKVTYGVAPQQAFEPMVMVALADTAATPERQHPLDAVVGFLGDECGVSAGVLLIV